jgi:competence protein ComEC
MRAHPRTPLLWICAGLLAGQAAAAVAPGRAWEWSTVAGALGLVWLGCRRAESRACACALALVAAALGHWQVDRRLRPVLPADHITWFAGARAVVRGRFAERPAPRPAATLFVLDTTAARRGGEWHPIEGRLRLTVHQVTRPWHRGDVVEAVLTVRHPHNFGNPGEFDFEAYLARRGIYATAFANNDADWRRVSSEERALAVERWRDRVAAMLSRTLDPTTARIVAALLLGETGALPTEVRDRYAQTGLSHVLVVAGLHLGIIAAISYAAARWLLARSRRALLYANVPKLAMAATLVPIGIYAALADAGVATTRAEITALLAISAMLLDRPRNWLAALAVAALAISLCWPGAILEVGFQLSFAAVLAIVLGMRRVVSWWRRWEEARLIRLRGSAWRWVRHLVLISGATGCVMLGTAPLVARYFNQVSLIAPVANVLVVPLLALACAGGLLASIAVVAAPGLAERLFAGVGLLVAAVDSITRGCAAVPGASFHVVTPSVLELGFIYGLLVLWFLPTVPMRRLAMAVCAVGLAVDAAYWAAQRTAPGALAVTFVSVGQGDCAVVEFPRGAVMVIDGGGLSGEFDVGRQIVAPFLWQRKIARVEVLALSHPDFDHFGGLGFLADAFGPRAFWSNGDAGTGPRFALLSEVLRDRAVAQQTLARGFAQTIDGVDVRVLHPSETAAGTDNNRSLTIQLRYGPTSVLLPGDLEALGERALVAESGAGVQSTVLKVPHHGSRSSSSDALLDAVTPRIAVVSVGADNRFGFPHPAVLEAYRRRGIALWRTDRDGAVSLRIAADGGISVTTGRAPGAVEP